LEFEKKKKKKKKKRLKLDPRGSQSVQTAAFFALVLMAATKPAGEGKIPTTWTYIKQKFILPGPIQKIRSAPYTTVRARAR